MKEHQPILIITGPTASGKSALASDVAKKLNGEIINADVGQFYEPLTIGTAKPLWKESLEPCHLFDILDKPVDLSVARYRSMVINLVHQIYSRGKLPIIVGGSGFYIKSLFYPPLEQTINPPEVTSSFKRTTFSADTENLWEKLNAIDPIRAKALHHHDLYRIQRALDIWETTGQVPSSFMPRLIPPFSANILFLDPDIKKLENLISLRTRSMIFEAGWIEEAQELINTPWDDFVRKKNMIGYTQLIEWIQAGSQKNTLSDVIDSIVIETRQYARRQGIFLRKFKQQLDSDSDTTPASIKTISVSQVDTDTASKIYELFGI